MNDALFEFGEANNNADFAPAPARDEQVQEIRERFDTLPLLSSMDARQEFVETTVLRRVPSLRELTALEARRVIDRLKSTKQTQRTNSGNAWDDRDHDTWIDKL